ncbi:ubiquitin carboxyl-terminal hydrolase UCH54, putative [Plasmodium yoelii]|uniref:ubiquitinyl hydrolase 1 n=3 Tax=Plasmodium yoelii TaxID=5861 RepID=A0AAE9WNS0_PLAYO|nr:ubiquitin carboxyl-terminal hydrolase UCH54, putative [Plasmodium yoelii]EAA16257.1 ubiquitin carboxyl-terminal hydrolase isozyme l5 [Plasmodium yoelii yoelii]WBY57457.1 ubiquitin carboxyl-terminal hydrolase UCH54 [Plasmodium yoelii yoelii]CDU18101.1 deubiquinating/deneddylating enzyme, putative [Plasmodium yoelii]VTZ78518.1 ubiquitin carboxyl-terminal hydrolase UCH54, putative [Plasmodium yoelii]|eukprot:XP_724692.1 ubiquitin carboxyl-terminal hydrolase UCH54, putative [Plasmodium yoelii]
MQSENDSIGEWCLIESNPCIFYEMLKQMGAKNLSAEDVYDLDHFDNYINNKDEIKIEHILSIQEYRSEKEKEAGLKSKMETEPYNSDIDLEDKYNKLLNNFSHVFGIIFLFNIGKSYDRKKYKEHNIPENLFFAKQVIPNACATQAILSIIFNKNIKLNENIENIKTFSINFDSTMKGLTLSNCNFLRNIHNSFKTPVYIENDDLYHNKKKESNSFHFVSYIEFEKNVYLLDGLQEGPILITDKNDDEKKEIENNWINIARNHIKKDINIMSNSEDDTENRFNILAIIKDKECIINEYINIHRIFKQRISVKLISLGENIEFDDEINEDDYYFSNKIPSIDQLTSNIEKLHNILKKSSNEINFLENLLTKEIELKASWDKERTFKFYNFYPFIISSIDLMAKHKILKPSYEKEKQKRNN